MIQSPHRDAQGSMTDPQARSARIIEALFPDRRERDVRLILGNNAMTPDEGIARVLGGGIVEIANSAHPEGPSTDENGPAIQWKIQDQSQSEERPHGQYSQQAHPKYGAEEYEGAARAIAASKRGIAPEDPIIDRVWRTYVGMARAAVLAWDAAAVMRGRVAEWEAGNA